MEIRLCTHKKHVTHKYFSFIECAVHHWHPDKGPYNSDLEEDGESATYVQTSEGWKRIFITKDKVMFKML